MNPIFVRGAFLLLQKAFQCFLAFCNLKVVDTGHGVE